MNVITVDSKDLEGKFKGINANQINANMVLLYFIENRIASLNKEPLPHPELIGLFSQLFKGSGLNPQEYITTSTGGALDDVIKYDEEFDEIEGIFSIMEAMFFSDNYKKEFNMYRKNSYLLLSMPTNFEIAINNFQGYPTEIRMYLQELNREQQRDKNTANYVPKLENVARGGPLENPLFQNTQRGIKVSEGGNIKTQKNKTQKNKTQKNKNTRKSKSKKSQKNRKTIKKHYKKHYKKQKTQQTKNK
jgi:hypothetical protein